MTMTPEQLLEQLKEACGENLRGAVLYGSAAAGDNIPGRSDSNIMVLLNNTGLAALRAVSSAAKAWMKKGNPPPLVFSPEQLRMSADTFPIELSDMKGFHRLLFGENPLADIRIDPAALRLAVEREFKGKLLVLREACVLAGGDGKALAGLMAESLSPVLVLCRAALRLYEDPVPASKLECAVQLRRHAEFDAEIFRLAHEMRARGRGGGPDMERLFDRYLAAIEQLCLIADKWKAGVK